MTAPCPHCGTLHDISARFTGERVYCRCGGWFLIQFLPGGAQLVKCDAPATWPKETR
jgi:hypothetical protein